MNRVRAYLSLSGSFSRAELLLATGVLVAISIFFAVLRTMFPETISEEGYRWMVFALYPIWGVALGKRSRDLGTTFTYGMILGMIFPVIGIVFLFQSGKKEKSPVRTEAGPPPFRGAPYS